MDKRRQQLEMQLSAYLDNELAPNERREVEARLAADEKARAVLDQLRATVEAVRGLPRMKASEQLIESLRARMERQSLLVAQPATMRVAGASRSYFRWTAAAAVIALTVTAGYLMWWPGQDLGGPTGQMYATNDAKPDSAAPVEGNLEKGAPPSPRPAAEGRRLAPGRELAASALSEPATPTPEAPAAAPAMRAAPATMAPPSPVRPELTRGMRGEPAAEAENKQSEQYDTGAEGAGVRTLGMARAQPTAQPVTVIELAFADTADQEAAARLLRDEYSFEPAAAPTAGAALGESLTRYVPSAEAAREVAESVRYSVASAKYVAIHDVPKDASLLAKDADRDGDQELNPQFRAGFGAYSRQPGASMGGMGGVGALGGVAGADTTPDTVRPNQPARELDPSLQKAAAPPEPSQPPDAPPAAASMPPAEVDKAATPPTPVSRPAGAMRAAGRAAPEVGTRDRAVGQSAMRGMASRIEHGKSPSSQPEDSVAEEHLLQRKSPQSNQLADADEPRGRVAGDQAVRRASVPQSAPSTTTAPADAFGVDWSADMGMAAFKPASQHIIRLYLWIEPPAEGLIGPETIIAGAKLGISETQPATACAQPATTETQPAAAVESPPAPSP